MRKARRHGRRFAAGRRVVGKSSHTAELTGLGKGVRETAVVLAAAQAASETEGGQESRVDRAPGQVGRVTGQRSVVASAARLVALGTPGEAESQQRSRENELDVIQVCLAYVDAQREYYLRDPMNAALLQYAPKFISTKGKRDGLYWETAANEPPSPLGPLVAQARREGYKRTAGKPVPYHGSYYKMLPDRGLIRRVAPMTMWCTAR